MRKILLIVFIACWFSSKGQLVNALHYKYELNLGDKNDSIYGKATMKMICGERQAAISFNLKDIEKNGKGMVITAVSINEPRAPLEDNIPIPENRTSEFLHDGDSVLIPIFNFKKGDTAIININYRGIPADGLIISKNKHGDRTFFADNWPNRAHHWIPCVDRPDDKASFEFLVTAPSHYSVVSNGIKVEEKETGNGFKLTHWKEEIPQPTKIIVIGVARFATKIYDDSPKDIPVSAWVYPQDSTKGFYDYGLAPEILKFFSDYIAPYPYKKLANVQSKTIFGGMENASAIFYAENSVTGDRSKEDLLAHEIAHQWFGNMASEKSFQHLWLSEGFATYLTNLYFEKKYGKEAAIERLKNEREEVIAFTKTTSKAVVDSTKDLMSLLNANSYQKGSWILHMLRNEVGDTLFQKIIQTYYNRFKGGNAESRDFTKVATEVMRSDMRPFFHQWLYRPGIPQLNVKWKWSKNKLTITLNQVQKMGCEFPLEIEIVNEDGSSTNSKLNIHKKTEVIILPMFKKPLKILLDPNTNLLFQEVKK